jgi:hypothetical protein
MELPKDLKDEICEYCRLNDITDLNAFMVKMLRQGYNSEKYGPTPFQSNQKQPEIIEKEVIKEVEVIKEIEKIIEVPVEVIKEVIVERIVGPDEKIVEVPVEIIKEVEKIVEVPVEVIKEVYVNEEEKIKNLKQQIENLKIELELEKNRKPQEPINKRIEEKSGGLGNVINWVSKDERKDNIYDE